MSARKWAVRESRSVHASYALSSAGKNGTHTVSGKVSYESVLIDFVSLSLCHAKGRQQEMHSEGSDPCDDTLEGNHPHSPSRPILPLDGSDRRDAGRIEQAEGQKGECHARCQDRRESFLLLLEKVIALFLLLGKRSCR